MKGNVGEAGKIKRRQGSNKMDGVEGPERWCDSNEWWFFEEGGRILMMCMCERYEMKLTKFTNDEIATSFSFIPPIL